MNYYQDISGENGTKFKSFYQAMRVFVFLISIIATFYIANNVDHTGYEEMFLLPMVYGIVFVTFISPVLLKKTNIFLAVFTAVSFTRYVILPMLIVYSDLYGGRSAVPPSASSYELALRLMVYELIVVSVVIYFIFRKINIRPSLQSGEIKLPKNIFIYLVFFVLTALLVGMNPGSLKSFYFIVPPDDLEGFGGGAILSSLSFYFLAISKYIIYLLLMSYFNKKYLITNNKLYIFYSFIITLMNIFVIFGANRADFVITTIVSVILFYKLYPRQSKIASFVIILAMVLITGFISSHRDNATYSDGADPVLDLTNTLQVYLGGPYNVAIATEAADRNPEGRDILHFGYDIFRPAMGFNILLKELDLKMSSDYFNERIFFSEQKSHIIPIIGQGYFYFGFMFSPIIMIIFLFFVTFLIRTIQKQSRIELIFFLTIPIARIGLAMGQNGSILMNDTSFFLLLSLIVYYFNNKITFRS